MVTTVGPKKEGDSSAARLDAHLPTVTGFDASPSCCVRSGGLTASMPVSDDIRHVAAARPTIKLKSGRQCSCQSLRCARITEDDLEATERSSTSVATLSGRRAIPQMLARLS